jgi:alpha-L-rhamnosidase
VRSTTRGRGRPSLPALGALAAVTAVTAATALALPAAANAADVKPTTLRTQDMRAPLGIDVTTPTLSWRLDSSARGAAQSAYEIRAASSEAKLQAGDADLWATGKVDSAQVSDVRWAGAPLTSRSRVVWKVRTWDQHGAVSDWSAPATFELGLLDRADWTGSWIANRRFDQGVVSEPIEVNVGAQNARYVRLDASRLGIGANDAPDRPHFQLAELEVVDSADGDANRARGATVTGNSILNCCGWTPRALVDGVTHSGGDPKGFTSSNFDRQDVNVWVTLDLGSRRTFDTVKLWPRTDARTEAGLVPNFPEDFTVRVSDDNAAFTTVGTRTGQIARLPEGPPALPLFATDFQTEPGKQIAHARVYLAGQGVQRTTLNGSAVTDAVLQPGYTLYERRAEYATYDVTRLVRAGANAIGVELAQGMYDAINPTDGRYAKLTRSVGGPRVIGQVEITYTDGSRQVVDTGTDWKTTFGATTASWWWGGESFDARRVIPGWDQPGTDRSSWAAPVNRDAAAANVALSGLDAPPIEVTETLKAVNVIDLGGGRYTVDLGINFAGWPEISVDLPAGTTIRLRPAEKVNTNGTVNQQSVRSTMWSTFTSDGSGRQTWHPQFMYHGLRYLQIEGMPAGRAITADDVRGLVLRTANEKIGTFASCTPMLDDIHRIIDRATQSNMYSVMTDCPHREKLGWLGDHQLNLRGVELTYDVLAHTRSIIRKLMENQYSDGFVPNIIPQYAQFGGATRGMFDDDPNWGGAMIFMPYELYLTYGDTQTIRTAWPAMVKYIDYMTSKAPTGLLDYDTLGDWFTFDGSTPKGLVSTAGYARMAEQMALTADVLGEREKAAEYRQLHDKIRVAFNLRYRRGDGVTYGSGSQASDALALDANLVPAADRPAVLRHLLASIKARGDHTDVGIVALPALFRVLEQERRDDVIYDVATVPTAPSYAYQVINGATALTEAWDGPTRDTGENSQNHFMLGAIQEWFTSGAAGIEQAPGTVGYRQLVIEPAIIAELDCALATYRTPRGVVKSEWRRSKRGTITHDVTIPAGTTAEVRLPIDEGQELTEGGRAAAQTPGVASVRVEGDMVVATVSAGSYAFRVADKAPEPPRGGEQPQPRGPETRDPRARPARPSLQLLSAKSRKGRLTLGLRLDARSTVRVKVVDRRAGKRVGGRCVTGRAARKAKRAKKCVRLVTLGTVVKRNVAGGLPTMTLPAKVRGTRLKGRTVQLSVWAERDGRRSAVQQARRVVR